MFIQKLNNKKNIWFKLIVVKNVIDFFDVFRFNDQKKEKEICRRAKSTYRVWNN